VLVANQVAQSERSDGDARSAAVSDEVDALKMRIAVLSRSEQVARAALADLQQTLRERDDELSGLRTDLAFYARLVGGGKREGFAVHALRVKPVANSRAWNFTATLTQNFKLGEEIKGHLTLSVEGVVGGKLKTIDWNALNQGQDTAGIGYGFKYFQQVSGTIMFPGGFLANRVIVRADGDGGRVEQTFSWKDAVSGEEDNGVQQGQTQR
ncbi:MAG: DUF6776 family protein, partial [Steroidobacteraceae bacterium]